MELPLQITVHNTELDASGRELIRQHQRSAVKRPVGRGTESGR